MDFLLIGHDYEHAVQTIIQVFYQNESYKRLEEETPNNGVIIVSEINNRICSASLVDCGKTVKKNDIFLSPQFDRKEAYQAIAATIYNLLSEITGYKPPWGTLTGVRPAKIVQELYKFGKTHAQAYEYLSGRYLTRRDKINLCLDVAAAEKRILEKIGGSTGIGIYIGIPFCPTRCHYCSFTSYPLKQYESLLDGYFNALFKEIEFLSSISEGKRLETVYIGGGTPTSITADRLETLLRKLSNCFSKIPEFTVEAGRPDSISQEKLEVMAKFGVNRISINPQSMNGETLKKIGREHKPSDFINSYEMAENLGFHNINCDLILGLPGETVADTENTFKIMRELSPPSLTVHTLAIKRAATLNRIEGRFSEDLGRSIKERASIVENMLEISSNECIAMGLKPYYLYRQKNMVGNFENVGYAKPGFECSYNIQTMTEKQSVFAAGAGAVTKLAESSSGLIRRAFNVKDLKEYIERIDEMIERKKTLFSQE